MQNSLKSMGGLYRKDLWDWVQSKDVEKKANRSIKIVYKTTNTNMKKYKYEGKRFDGN